MRYKTRLLVGIRELSLGLEAFHHGRMCKEIDSQRQLKKQRLPPQRCG